MFGAIKFYPFFLDLMGFYGTFWSYGGVMTLLVLYGALFLPENKGKSLVKTEDIMIKESGDILLKKEVI